MDDPMGPLEEVQTGSVVTPSRVGRPARRSGVVRINVEAGQAVEREVAPDAHSRPGQRRTQAEVDAAAECEVRIRVMLNTSGSTHWRPSRFAAANHTRTVRPGCKRCPARSTATVAAWYVAATGVQEPQ